MSATKKEIKQIRPQEGPQESFLSTPADIAIYGGAAGSGKSYALLLEPLRHIRNELFRGVIFRRTSPQIRAPGGLWDESHTLYPYLNAEPRESQLDWTFKLGARVKFSHMELKKDMYSWQGAQLPFIGFDELTHFDEEQFWYMFSRNRSTSGISGYIRATCNADAESWVSNLVSWYWDDKTGYAIPERSGKIRWFVRIDNTLHWANTRESLEEKYGKESLPKSFTFISAYLTDNKILLEKDPSYLANLKALSLVERERLLHGNWKIKPTSGMFFRREWFKVVENAPTNLRIIRYWDRASTEPSTENKDPDYTVGLKVGRAQDGTFYVLHMIRLRGAPNKVETAINNAALSDGRMVTIGLEQEPGASGKSEINYYTKQLSGYALFINPATTKKEIRAAPASSQAEVGNIVVVRGEWNEDFFTELENFPEGAHDDIVDTLSGGVEYYYKELVGKFAQQKPTKTINKTGGNESVMNTISRRIKTREF